MVVSHKKESGAIFLTGVLIVAALGTSMSIFSWYVLTKQASQSRKINGQYQHKVIMDSITSRLIDDLRIAKYYPEVQGLPNPPVRPAGTTRCPLPTPSNLDQYLRGTCAVPYASVSPTGTQTTKTQKNLNPLLTPCPKTGLAGSSCYRYDIGDFYIPVSPDNLWGLPLFPDGAAAGIDILYIVPETAPVITLTKNAEDAVLGNLYFADVSVTVCKKLVVGRGSPVQPDLTGGWISAGNPPAWTVACPAADIVPLQARVFIRTNGI